MGPLKEGVPLIAADILSIYKDLNFANAVLTALLITSTCHCRAISESMYLHIAFILHTTYFDLCSKATVEV